MAEDLENFSPLDPLGPAYGKINKPALDIQGVSPFEGDRITQAPINFPRPFAPALPGLNLTQPQENVKRNVVGAPGVQPNKNNTASDYDIKKAHFDYIKGSLQANTSKDNFAKIYSYDAGPDGNAFYDRYMAYGAETFDKIGFSPLRDNEAVFNSRTTMADDWGRMLKHSFWPLFTSGFVSGPKSLAKMLSGDFTSADLEDAEMYEDAAAIGMSTKGGLMGFMNNTVMNFGYTAGIISEAILEEVGAAILAPETGGLSLFAATANNLRKIKGIGAVTGGTNAVRASLKSMSNVSGARQAWNTFRNAATENKVLRYFNPAENTFDALRAIDSDNLRGLAALSKTAGGFYRDVRTLNMAISEARLEAGMVENAVYEKAYRKYYNETGEAPNNTIQQDMVKNAKDASLDTFYKNAALIYATNKITFANITNPRGGIRNFIKSTVDDVATVGGGKFGNIGKIVYNNTAKSFAFEANNIKNLAKSWWKNPGFKTAGKTIGYFKANFTEGFQENFQEITARANERYYLDSFDSKLRQTHEYAMGVADYNMKSQSQYFKEELGREVSMQGFETFASGFFMGMLAAPLNNSVTWLSVGYNRVFDKEAYNEYKTKKTEITQNLVNTLNNVKMDEFLKSRLFDYGAQDIIGRVKATGNKKEALDAENEALINSMLSYGVSEVYAEKIRSMNELDDKEFMDAMNIEKDEIPAYRERVNYAADKMDRIRKTQNYFNDKFPNPIRPADFKDVDPTTEEYQDMVALHFGWDAAVKNAVFFNETFEDTKQRMGDIEKKFLRSVNREKTGLRELGLLLTPSKLDQELQLLNSEINTLEGFEKKDSATVKELAKKKEIAKNIENYINALNEFDNFFNRDQTFESAKAEVTKKLGREATKEEVEKFVDRKLGKLDDEKKQTKALSSLKDAFSKYSKYVSEINNDVAFDDNLEKAFTLLVDHYKLGAEARQMAKYIDRLNNPETIFEIADRNKAWMKDLYNRRKTYYNKMVKAQMKVVEHNALLNTLADQGIYVPLEQFERWQQTGAIPSEFFNNVTKQVLRSGSEEYAFWSAVFLQANALDTEEEGAGLAAELDQPVELISPTSIQEVEAALKNLDAKQFRTSGNKYINLDDESDEYARVSTIAGDYEGTNQRAANRGTIIDDMLRGYINGTATKIEDIRKIYLDHPLKDQTQRFSDDFIRQLFDIFNQVKEITTTRGITLTAKVPTLWGIINNQKYAGTIDLLGIDKSGQVYIIDLKTSSQERRSHYEMDKFLRENAGDMYNSIMEKIKAEEKNNILNVKNFTAKEQKVIDQLVEQFKGNINVNLNRLALYDYARKDSIQQSGYAELLRQRTGITAKNITIFPVQVTIEDKVYTKAEPNMAGDKFTMQVEIDRKIFPETPKVEAKPESKTVSIIDKKAAVEQYKGKSNFSVSFSESGTSMYLSPSMGLENSTDEAKRTLFDILDLLAKNPEVKFIEGGILRVYESSSMWYPFVVLGDYVAGRYKPSVDKVVTKFKEGFEQFTQNELDVLRNSLETKTSPYLTDQEKETLEKETEEAPETTANIEAKKADIEKEREEKVNEFLRNVKNNKGERRFDDPNLQDDLEIKQYSRNVAKALAEGQPITFEFLKANLGARFTTNSSNLIIVDFNRNTNNIVLSQEGTVSYIAVDKNNNISYDFEDRGKQINLKKARPISLAEGDYQKQLKEINAEYDAKLDALQGAEKAEGINVGKARSEKATNKLAKLGFTDLMLENMTESEITEALTYNTPEEASEFREAIIDKQRALDIEHPYITEFTLYKDAQLVAKQAIQYEENGENVTFAEVDDIVVVESLDIENGEVTLQKLGSDIAVPVDIAGLDELFAFKDQIMTEPEKAEETITNKKEAAEFTKEGNQILDGFLGNNTRQSEIERGVENPDVTNQDLDDSLLDDLKC